jgi:mitochondrial inner membrane protease ATP23
MTDSSSHGGQKGPRKLSPGDQKQFEHWQRILSSYALLSPNDQANSPPVSSPARSEPIDPKKRERQHTACISVVNKLFEKSPIIIFMNSELKKVGCSPPIYCAPCPSNTFGGFHPDMGITLCENRITKTRRMESTLAHEMVHAFDHCRFNFNYNDLRHIACGEVSQFDILFNSGSGGVIITGVSISGRIQISFDGSMAWRGRGVRVQ